MTNKPLTIDEILTVHFNPCESGCAETHFDEDMTRAKQQLSQLIDQIIGEDEHAKYPDAFIPSLADFRIFVRDHIRAEQRQRAKEAGLDL